MHREDLSGRIRIAGLIATIMVVFRHSLNYLAFFDSWTGQGVSGHVEDTMSILTEIAVPWFFLVSGYFFLQKSYYDKSYFSMLCKKTRTLFVPFVIWNVIGALVLLCYDRSAIGSTPWEVLCNLLYSYWNAPLWYVRDLMLLMLLYPLYGWLYCLRYQWLLVIVLCLAVWNWTPVDTTFLSSESILFFLLGGMFAQRQSALSWNAPVWLVAICLVLWGVLAINTPVMGSLWQHKFADACGLFAFWHLLGRVPVTYKKTLLKASAYSFLVYVMHAYPMKCLKRIIGHYFFGSDIAAMLTYLILPFVVTSFVIVVGYCWKRYLPRAYAIATGGR